MKRVLAITLAFTLTFICVWGAPTEVKAATQTHTHNFIIPVYTGNFSGGSYTHSYIYGYDRYNQPVYGECLVVRDTDTYTYKCNQCSETYGYGTETYGTHAACGLGRVPE